MRVSTSRIVSPVRAHRSTRAEALQSYSGALNRYSPRGTDCYQSGRGSDRNSTSILRRFDNCTGRSDPFYISTPLSGWPPGGGPPRTRAPLTPRAYSSRHTLKGGRLGAIITRRSVMKVRVKWMAEGARAGRLTEPTMRLLFSLPRHCACGSIPARCCPRPGDSIPSYTTAGDRTLRAAASENSLASVSCCYCLRRCGRCRRNLVCRVFSGNRSSGSGNAVSHHTISLDRPICRYQQCRDSLRCTSG